MSLAEIKQKIKDNFDRSEFKELIESGKYAKAAYEKITKIFTSFEELDSERTEGGGDFDGYAWRFKIDDKFYQVDGWYSSYDGTDLDDPFDFYEVVEEEQVIKVWVPVE